MDKLYQTQDADLLACHIANFPLVSFTNRASDTFREVMADIKSGYDDSIHPKLFELYKDNYHKGLAMFGEPETGSRYFDLNEKFKLNTARLAAYKSYKVTGILKGLPEKDFDKNAMQVLKNFNRYQATEYNAIVARARSAKQFIDFKQDADLYPNMEWIMTRSANPREEHLAMVGTIRPINDPFWNENQPGNLWNCKCDWQPTDKEATGIPKKEVKPATGLDGNPAMTGELITDAHPYIRKVNNLKEIEHFVFKNHLEPLLSTYRESLSLKGLPVESDNIKTGKMTIIKNSIRQIARHNYIIKIQSQALFLESSIKNWEYIGWADAEEKHREAAYFFYYKVTIGKVEKYANVAIHKEYLSEVPYAIINTIDMKKVKEGVPDDIDKWIKK
ncbi:MAG: hypothetical protein KAZ36_00290 [Bacteroidales bacterium]|nr:hypothetical protein [Bacteroidales bacterium]